MKFLVWGGSGWIGAMVVSLLKDLSHEVVLAQSRLTDYIGIVNEISHILPDRVINAAGITGVPNVDWCETHKRETFFVNTIGVVNLAQACFDKNLHLTNYATGCIYEYKNSYEDIYSEEDEPNFTGSTYSKSKIYAEKMLENYSNVLTLRIRLPLTNIRSNKNIICKLINYSRVVNIPNSMSVLPELLPISLDMSVKSLTGIYNLVNPGVITHNQLLEMYKKHIDPSLTWENFTESEQNSILASKRSNCSLDTTKLTNLYPVRHILDAADITISSLSSS